MSLSSKLPAISSPQAIEILKKLAAKRNISLGRMSRIELMVTLAAVSVCLPSSVKMSEVQVNKLLRAWLANTDSMLRIDHVELRRSLIDYGFWQRDSFGRGYWRSEEVADSPLKAYMQVFDEIDPLPLMAAHRAVLNTEREKRKLLAIGISTFASKKI
ncbi:MAG: DUF2087 domain-containing protein [Burkholderiaceae bacterium]|nr:DUF2087 domain-containing protein [Burkholderiaceae bacterium]